MTGIRPSRTNEWLAMLARAAKSTRGLFGLILAGTIVLIALVGPWLAPHSPTEVLAAPFSPPSKELLLGADILGRDALSRILHGGAALLGMAVLATVLSVGSGAILGVVAAYFRGTTDSIVMRFGDVLLAFPQLVLALLFISVFGPHWWLIVLAIALAHSPQIARVIRSSALDVTERDFVSAAEAIGLPRRKIILAEILPNLATPLMVETGLRLTYSIIFISALSFLGLGQPPPAPDWGVMINENRLGIQVNIWPVLVPAVLIALLTIGTNLFTDAFSRASLRVGGAVQKKVAAPPRTGSINTSTGGSPDA